MHFSASPFLPLPILAVLFAVPASGQSSSAQASPVPVAELDSAPLPATPLAVHAAKSASAAPDATGSAATDPSVVNTLREPVHSPERLHLFDWSMIGAASTLRALDYVTTEKGLEHPQSAHEAILPAALVKNKPAFAGFEAGSVVLNYGAYRLLVRHNLRSIARVSQYMYVAVMTGQIAKNYQVLGKIPSAR
jgi:hypothetical protein